MQENKKSSVYVDKIENVEVFKFFRENGPAGEEFSTKQEDLRNHRFLGSDLVHFENGNSQLAMVLGDKSKGENQVFAWFVYNDFDCQYKDFNKNEVDMSKDWCKFVCATSENPKDYANSYAEYMRVKISELENEEEINLLNNDVDEMISFTESLSAESEMSE